MWEGEGRMGGAGGDGCDGGGGGRVRLGVGEGGVRGRVELWPLCCHRTQVEAYPSAPWSPGKVTVPLNQTSGWPASLSAGRTPPPPPLPHPPPPPSLKFTTICSPETFPVIAVVRLLGGALRRLDSSQAPDVYHVHARAWRRRMLEIRF